MPLDSAADLIGRDLERITRRFYDRFKAEHDAMQAALDGVPAGEQRRCYVSATLDRLMLVYFVQQKGFLDGDPHYLRHRLAISRLRAPDRFYRDTLRPLFFEGLAKRPGERSSAAQRLLGAVPYLGGGLFAPHAIEMRYGERIQIADAAFERLFDFFDQYRWHLDERPPCADNTITPGVLGYIFEKYINRKQTGAYYTGEDIAGYIARATIIPFLLDAVRQCCPAAFGAQAIARLLRAAPDRYIYAAMRHGAELPLPAPIAAGQRDCARRLAWNEPAPPQYGLACEIWREVIARRARYAEIRERLVAGRIGTTSDLISCNLDIARLAQNLIETCDSPDALDAVWQTITRMTILDPTCGSGAFLFAALNALEPLYGACLDRMEALLAAGDRADVELPEGARETFRAVLAGAAQHPSRRYFALKSIIANNLYGVDLMEEAVEICKLRLFLKLIAQIERGADIEPLPDIDFNIRAGNALVGFASYAEAERAASGDTSRAQELERLFVRFRARQAGHERDVELSGALNRALAGEYGADQARERRRWLTTHRPFHWFVEFYAILERGGFDIVIGNPPYVAYSKILRDYTVRGYRTEPCANLYAFVLERSLALLREQGRCGMIVPIASVSTERMAELQRLYAPLAQWHSHYAVRPGKLFAGVDMNLTISLLQKTDAPTQNFVSGYRRWSNGAPTDRPLIFATVAYTRNPRPASHANPFPKLGSAIEARILERMLAHGKKLRDYTAPAGTILYYHSGGRYWRKALLSKLSSHYRPLAVAPPVAPIVFGLLNSQLFYWYWISNSNCMDVVAREVLELPVFALDRVAGAPFAALMGRLLEAYDAGNTIRVRRGARINVAEVDFDMRQAKPIIDEIDILLADCYLFTDEETDFILNYDIKYRGG